MLRHLKRVYVQFAPTDPRATSARELLQRLGNEKARKSNPECQVEYKVDEEGEPGKAFVELQFADGEQRRLATADFRVADIMRVIEQKATEAQLRAVMKDVGFDQSKAENRIAAGVNNGTSSQQRQR